MSYRIPQLYDRVSVMDREGRQATCMVVGLRNPGHPQGELLVNPIRDLSMNWSRSIPFSDGPRPGHWCWPTSQASGAASSDPLSPHPLSPTRGSRVKVVRNGQLVGATVMASDDTSNPRASIIACADGDYLGLSTPAERRYQFADLPPREGCWCW
ncbi:hypothetical protein [Singulisphaera sp. PoT]|uniref:hypothetical protein n=1 Tax=Singulisphaera sp. PoT TaxID=3411797 RepID=UPI003BF53663